MIEVATDVTPAIAACLARNTGPTVDNPAARQPPEYAVSAQLDGSVINLALGFRSGAAYCCYEWGCHLALHDGRRWEILRRELAACDVAVPEQMELRLAVTVEAGALFFDFARPLENRRGVYRLSPSDTVQYRCVAAEAGGPVK